MQNDEESSEGKAGPNGKVEQKWCSVDTTNPHDDGDCYAQGAPRPS